MTATRRIRKPDTGILAWLLLACLSAPGGYAATVVGPDARTIFYYSPVNDAWNSLLHNARKISILAPQVLAVDQTGAVRGGIEERVRALAAEQGIEIMPLLFNEDFSTQIAHSVLGDPSLRQRVVSEAVRLCEESKCAGLQLDFEGVAAEDAAGYLSLIQELAAALHERHLYFSVALASPLFTASRPLDWYAASFGGFGLSAVPFDLKEVGRHADFITLMTYDQHWRDGPPGPVAGYPWVEQSIRFLLQYVPREKISIGLAFYGRRWCRKDATELSFADIQALVKSVSATVRRHPWQRTPWFEFNKNGCRNIVFFEDRNSLREKLRLMRRYRLAGFSAWRLGQEDPSFWDELKAGRR